MGNNSLCNKHKIIIFKLEEYMLAQIKNVPNQKIIDLKYLKTSKLPLFLYGMGSYALDVKSHFLDRHDIRLDGVVIDDAYYLPNLSFENYQVQPLCDILTYYSSINIIVGFSKCRKKISELSSNKRVAKCVFIDSPGLADHFFDYDFIKTHNSLLNALYHGLADDYSRKVMLAYINAKISGYPGDLYDLNMENEKQYVQYFPPFLHFSENEIFVDCGAFDGDTILSFSRHTNGKYDKIYGFECDKINVEKLKKNVSQLNHVNIVEKACFSSKSILSFSTRGNELSKIDENGTFQIETEKIDDIVSEENVSFIKMDIEGAELEALKGAKHTIEKNAPKLAISVYHKPEDLITIPQYLLSLHNNYQLYLRNYRYISGDIILYCSL